MSKRITLSPGHDVQIHLAKEEEFLGHKMRFVEFQELKRSQEPESEFGSLRLYRNHI